MCNEQRRSCVRSLTALLMLLCTLPVQAEWARIPPEIRAALEHNAAAINPISVTIRSGLVPRLSPQETLDLVGWSGPPEARFMMTESRFIWQDRNFYMDHSGADGTRYQTSFNGSLAFTMNHPADVRATASVSRSHPGAVPGIYRTFGAVYLPSIGVSITGTAFQPDVQAAIRSHLHAGAELASIRNVNGTGNTLTVITLVTPNEAYARAHRTNLDDARAQLRRGRNTEEEIQQIIDNIRLSRDLPPTIEISYALDASKGYSVAWIEQHYDDGRLIERTTNSDFEYIPSRDVWLPRLVRIDSHTVSSRPGTVFDEPPFSRLMQVQSDFGLGRVPDDTFTLADIEPGMRYFDNTTPGPQIQIDIEPHMVEQVRALLVGESSQLPGTIATVTGAAESPATESATRNPDRADPAAEPTGLPTDPVAQQDRPSGPQLSTIFIATLIIAIVVIITVRFLKRMK